MGMASIIGSGINGNSVLLKQHQEQLLLQWLLLLEVELMETNFLHLESI